jgi:3-deoxy-D-manno-octulosonate 8-phosphate phosphatase (KDO 8-P phosphatase)
MNYKSLLHNIRAFVFDVDGVFTDGMVLALPDGDMLRQHNSKDGYALRCALSHGYHIGIISGGVSESIRSRFAMLGVTDVYLGAQDKMQAFTDFCAKYKLLSSHVLVMGDDIPDIPIMRAAVCACCPADAVEEVKNISAYISHQNGGCGCVRDVIEQTLKIQGKWQ